MDENLVLSKARFLRETHLDQFSLDSNLPPVSVVIPTYNRSPNTPYEDSNPLGWCLDSLLSQRGDVLNEIIVVDDASTDHTEDIVSEFGERSDIPVKYIQNSENKGSSVSRNIAVSKSSNDLVMFVDDDCIFSRYMLFGANYTLQMLGEGVAALQVPVYHRRTNPYIADLKDIGIVDFEEGRISSNFGGFPREFLDNLEAHFLDEDLGILDPIPISNLGGVFLVRKKAFEDAGGFPRDFSWKNGYREETDLAIRLSQKGYRLVWTPDPKFHCIHLKYGAVDAFATGGIPPRQEPGLSRLINHSNVSREETGNRVGPDEWFFDYIVSTYVVLGKTDPLAAEQYLAQARRSFVEDNASLGHGTSSGIEDRRTRERIFQEAVEEGSRLVRRVS